MSNIFPSEVKYYKTKFKEFKKKRQAKAPIVFKYSYDREQKPTTKAAVISVYYNRSWDYYCVFKSYNMRIKETFENTKDSLISMMRAYIDRYTHYKFKMGLQGYKKFLDRYYYSKGKVPDETKEFLMLKRYVKKHCDLLIGINKDKILKNIFINPFMYSGFTIKRRIMRDMPIFKDFYKRDNPVLNGNILSNTIL